MWLNPAPRDQRSVPGHEKLNPGGGVYLCPFIPAVVSGSRDREGGPHQLLHRHQIYRAIQYFPGKGTLQAVRSEGFDLCPLEPLFHHDPDRLMRQAIRYCLALLSDSVQQRPGFKPPRVEPSVCRGIGSITQINRTAG